MHVYRHGSLKDHGNTLIADMEDAFSGVGYWNPYKRDLPTVEFRETSCYIDNLGGTYTVYVQLDISDIATIVQLLVRAAETHQDMREQIAGRLAPCREALVKLTALAHGYGPMPEPEDA